MATVAVVGATGGIGAHVVRQALQGGHTVRALVRTPGALSPQERLSVVQGDVLDVDTLRPLVDGVDVVLSCLGTRRGQPVVVERGTANIVEAMNGGRLAMISSIGVGDSAAQAKQLSRVFAYVIMPFVLKRQFADLAAAERVMERVPGGIRVRPAGLDNSPGRGRWTAGGPRIRLPMRVSRADVAAFMVSLIDDTSWDGQAVSVGA